MILYLENNIDYYQCENYIIYINDYYEEENIEDENYLDFIF